METVTVTEMLPITQLSVQAVMSARHLFVRIAVVSVWAEILSDAVK